MSEPRGWTVRKFADVGTSEEFVREHLKLHDLLGATLIVGEDREAAAGAIGTILADGLLPAFLELQSIRASVGQELPVVNRNQLFEDFSRKIWKTYKDLMQRAVVAMKFDIGFLFQKESIFEAGLAAFRKEYPNAHGGFEDYLRNVRTGWQNELSRFRNGFLEHQQGDRRNFAKFYDPTFVEQLFQEIWETIVNVLVVVMNIRMPQGTRIVEHSDAIHGPGWPNRFRFEVDWLQSPAK